MANTYLTRTPSSASNRKTWTWSAWVKRSTLSTGNQILFRAKDGNFPEGIQFKSTDILEYDHDISGTDYTVRTAMVFRDISAWYHIVVAKDTTQATETNRIKIYVNGEQQTLSEFQLGYPPQNYDGAINKNVIHTHGSDGGGYDHFNGSMTHVHFIDGTAYDASAFGETDTTTGEWKAKTSPSVTYGTNGFFILKDGNSVTDQSGKGNNFTVGGGTLIDLKDNPDNTFATLNPLQSLPVTNGSTYDGLAYSNNNTTAAETYGHWRLCASTIAGASGKFYAEIKRISGGTNDFYVGVASSKAVANNTNGYHYGKGNNTVGYDAGNGYIYVNDSGSSYGGGYANGDIIGIALDVTNQKVYFSKNGVWQNSGDPTSGSTGTGAISLTAGEDSWHIGMSPFNTTGSCNFGNGYFGTTAITTNSGNGYSGAEGSSKFNYTVPTGYSALSTKGLNE